MADQQDPNTDEAADPSDDLGHQKASGTAIADRVSKDDPQKAQKLADPDGEHDLGGEAE